MRPAAVKVVLRGKRLAAWEVMEDRWKFSRRRDIHSNVCKQGGFTPSSSSESTPAEPPKPAYAAPARKTTSSRAMKLGGNTRDVDSFVDQLESEGVKVGSVGAPVKAAGGLSKVPPRKVLSVEYDKFPTKKVKVRV